MTKQPLQASVEDKAKPAMGKSMMAGERVYKIGDLSREFDVTLRTLRFYEDRGLITPAREGTTRFYTDDDRERLRIALFGKRIGLSLGQISEVLDLMDGPETSIVQNQKIKAIYREQLDILAQRVEDMQNAMAELQTAIDAF